MAGHTEGAREKLFCALRMDKCECPKQNEYKKVMEGAPNDTWGKYPQKHRVKIAIERSPEAHHVLPVASVTGELVANKKIKLEVRENTDWCVNDIKNMIALPLFEMTFMHYIVHEKTDPPPFEKLPMHNYDHGAFQTEVAAKLKKVATDAEKNKKAHEKVTEELLGALNTLRDHYKPELAKRGTREKGTHVEFTEALKAKPGKENKQWYIPFSMALKPDPRPFPSGSQKGGLSTKLANVIAAWGKLP